MSRDWKRHLAIVVASSGSQGGELYKISTGVSVARTADGGARILTTRHGVIGATAVEIELEDRRGRAYEARLIWDSAAFDLALLECDASAPSVTIARPPDELEAAFTSVGYARAGKRDTRRPPVAFGGKLYPYDHQSSLLQVGIDYAPRDLTDWSGASGAPVFVGDALVGVIREVPTAFDGRRIDVIDLESVLEAVPELDELIRPVAVRREPVAAGSIAIALAESGSWDGGELVLTACVVVEDASRLASEIRSAKESLLRKPLVAASVKQRLRDADLASMLADPVMKAHVLAWLAVVEFLAHVHFGSADGIPKDQRDRLWTDSIAERMRKKSVAVVAVHGRRADLGDIASRAVSRVVREQRRSIPNPAIVIAPRDPLVELADLVAGVARRHLSNPNDETAGAEFDHIRTRMRSGFDVVSRTTYTREQGFP